MTQEENKIQELLKPRYLVIADYPGNPFKVQKVLTVDDLDNKFQDGEQTANAYPHLFRKLEWHEERDASEMPEYVKPDPNGVLEYLRSEKTIYKVLDWVYNDDNMWCLVGNHDHIHVNHIIPATESEYTAYISSPELK